jgi:hypothetical protein
MAHTPRPFPAAQPHGELREALPGLFFVQGSLKMSKVLPVRVSRNMVVVPQGDRLVIVNSVRLDDAGLATLDRLGKVTDVIRLAGAHGMDDPFYADRYKAKVWAIKGQRYTAGFDPKATPYFEAQGELDASSALPIAGAKLIVIDARPPEGMLLLPDHGGVMISGDCLQNWAKPDEYCSWLAGPLMRVGGFIKPHNIGPAWFKHAKPPAAQMRALLGHTWTNVLPAHGAPVLGDAHSLYRPVFDRVVPAG